ncbi:MAG: DUF5320 domain-containing protein [Alphaproteobacteria bacterium]
MPNFDGTGPEGAGPTGKMFGTCEQPTNVECNNFPRQLGRGRRFCRMLSRQQMNAEEEKAFLQTQIESQKVYLNFMQRRLDNLSQDR